LGSGDSTVNASDGDDTISVGFGDHFADLGDGNNIYSFISGSNTTQDGTYAPVSDPGTNLTIIGGSGNDRIDHDGTWAGYYVTYNITLGEGDNYFNGNAGFGTSTITAGNGDDEIYLSRGTNDIRLGGGNNLITLQQHNFSGGISNNYIETGSGNDAITTGDGTDTITAGSGADTINGLSGDKTVVSTGLAGEAVSVVFTDGLHDISTGASNDYIVLGSGNSTISAGLGDDTIYITNAATLTLTYTGGLDTVNGTVGALVLDIDPAAIIDFSTGYLVATIDAANILTVTGITDIAQVTFI
ncbi:hypothetical protein VZ95_17230, partial [Elstera litoralis]